MTMTGQSLATRSAEAFRLFRAGDESALDRLVDDLTPLVWHTARAQGIDRQAAEDVVQTTWLALWRSADRITDPQAVLQWILVTAKREAWRVGRLAARTRPNDPSTLDDEGTPDVADEVLAGTRGSIWRHVSGLPQRCRELLRMLAVSDRPDYTAVSSALGMPVGSIGPTRSRCLDKLRRSLEADPEWEGVR